MKNSSEAMYQISAGELAEGESMRNGRELCEIIPDGAQFAIKVQGVVDVRGLDSSDLEKAQGIVTILNRFIQNEKSGGSAC